MLFIFERYIFWYCPGKLASKKPLAFMKQMCYGSKTVVVLMELERNKDLVERLKRLSKNTLKVHKMVWKGESFVIRKSFGLLGLC